MTNKKGTKRALLTSVLSLLLCCSMLIGTTFAWFTDTVESGINRIQAGNLDVEVYYGKDAEPKTNKVAGATNIFTDVDGNEVLWEPGAVAYTNLNVVNEGSLALKYQFAMNFINENWIEGTNAKLSQVLKVAFLDGPVSGTREEILEAASGKGVLLSALTKSGVLTKEANQVYGVVIYWEPSVMDNNWNVFDGKTTNDGQPLHIDLGLKLIATQKDAESDSFGPDFDYDAWADGFQVYSVQDLVAAINNGETNIIVMDDIVVDGDLVIPAAAASTYSLRAATTTVVVNLNGKTLTANKVSAEASACITNGTLNLSEAGRVYASDGTSIALENVKIVSDGISAYAARNGFVTLKNVVFVNTATSNPIQNYGGTMILENVTVSQEGDANTAWYSSAVQTINLLVMNEETGKYEIVEQADTTINGGTYIGKKALMISAPGGNVTINGGTFIGSEFAIQGDFAPQYYTYGSDYESVITINGGNFTGAIKVTNAVKLVITGGTFSHDPSAYVASGYKAVTNDNGTYTVVFPQESFDSLIENAQPGETVEVPAGNYTFPASKLEEGMILECAPGTVFEGSSSLAIKGATIVGATFANPADKAAGGTVNGVFKDCTFTGYNALRYCYAGETVVFENCVFSGDLYGIHFDGGANDVTFKNCTFSGFNTMGSAITKLTMENCTFVANGRSNYNGINLWGNTDMVNSTFIFDGTAGTEWIDLCGDNKTASFTNCVVTDGVNTTDIATVVGDYGEGNTIIIDGVAQVEASSQDALNSAISSGNVNITLSEGDYKMPSSTTTGEVVISGTKDTVLDVTQGAYLDSADGVTIEGVTIKTSTGKANGNGSDYAALYAKDVTYVNCTFVGPMRVGRDGAKFINCTFTELGNDYVWTYGNDVTFENCTFNTDGKAILIYSDGGNEVSQVSVKDCVFNATEGAKAGAINNQNCAAIEIHNYGNGVNLVTEGNTYDANFSGEWRIKTYETGRTQVFVNGTEYTTIAIDGKTMTIDSNKNVTVND